VRLLRPLLIAGHAQSRRERSKKLTHFETVLAREIRTPFEIAPVEGLEDESSAGLQRFHHRGPERSVEKAYRNQHVVPLSGKWKANDVARDRADEPSLRSSRRGHPAQRFEAPVESFHRETFLGQVERIPSETAGDVEDEAAGKLIPAVDEKGRRSRQILGVPVLLLPACSI
jgi:hypothetical protein